MPERQQAEPPITCSSLYLVEWLVKVKSWVFFFETKHFDYYVSGIEVERVLGPKTPDARKVESIICTVLAI